MKKHGHSTRERLSPTYISWQNMRDRCNNPKCRHFHRYGGRGIRICDRWESFVNFLADMGERPAGKNLDRIDGLKGYSPQNCRWATPKEQRFNSSVVKVVTRGGLSLCLTDWAKKLGLNTGGIQERLASGWTEERAFTEPCNEKYRKHAT